MSIFEMAKLQFQKWTVPQMVIFAVLLILLGVGLICVRRFKKLRTSQAVAIWLLVLFLGIILGATTFTRTPMIRRIIKPVPFWSWYYGIVCKDTLLLEQNILNCLMLAPMGFLLPVIAGHPIKLRYAYMAGVAVAAIIEVSQLIFRLGWFEWDDMIHNGLSCLIGCGCSNIAELIKKIKL